MTPPSPTWNEAERREIQRLAYHWAARVGEPDLWRWLKATGRAKWLEALDTVFDQFDLAFQRKDPVAFDAALTRFRMLIRCGAAFYRKLHGEGP